MYRANRKRSFLSAVLYLAAALLFTVSLASAQNPVDHCGQSLYQSGEYILTTDLDCSGTITTGIDITASNVTFHLAGHEIASTDCDLSKDVNGIFVHGGLSGVRIEGGTVHGFNDGIVLSSSASSVSAMKVTKACLFGIVVQGSGNQVDTSVVTLSGLDGIGIGPSGGNHIVSNDVSNNVRVGVEISNISNDNVVERNIINSNGIVAHEQGGIAIFNGMGNRLLNNALNNNFEGIEIESPGNTAIGNRVSGSLDTGIFILGGSPSVVRGNSVFGSTLVDMLDDQAACGTDTWRGNDFQTDLVHDVPDGGPKKGCLT
jgi:parallel beta-helix repeat protein